MSKIKDAFKNGKAFIPFLTAGDPNLDVTKELILAMDKSGADIIEIGIPFSDPVAEGIVIQQADERALSAGTTTDKIFNMVKEVSPKCNCALAFMTYINCSKCGISAVIVPDVPFEEKAELAPACEKFGIDLISLIAPTSKDRIETIAKEAQGFLYCVSSMGVTGVRSKITTNIGEMIATVKKVSDIPCAVGFGISTPKQAEDMVKYADGVIVGSAIVKIIAQYGENSVEPVSEYVKSMKDAIR